MVRSCYLEKNEDAERTAIKEEIKKNMSDLFLRAADEAATEEKNSEEKGAKMAEAVLKAIESINNATD